MDRVLFCHQSYLNYNMTLIQNFKNDAERIPIASGLMDVLFMQNKTAVDKVIISVSHLITSRLYYEAKYFLL